MSRGTNPGPPAVKGLRPSPRTLTKAAVRCLWALNATAAAALGVGPPLNEAHRDCQLDLRPRECQ